MDLTLPYVKEIAIGNLLYVSGNSKRGSNQRGRWEGVQEGGEICTSMADSC